MSNTYTIFEKGIYTTYLRGQYGDCPIYIGPYKEYAERAAKDRSESVGSVR